MTCTTGCPLILNRSLLVSITLLALALGCDNGGADDAGMPDAGSMDATVVDAPMMFPDGTVFCTTDEECEDGIDCTRDSCGAGGFCQNVTDPATCDDGIFCNGVEQCDPRMGCVPGDRQTCNDGNVCTIDRCNEETKSCDRFPRDQDEDGDADWFCEGGTDCNDADPTVSGLVNEVCDDMIDNDCDEVVDEAECGRPRYDTCDDPIDVSAGGFFAVNTDGATPDYDLSCRGMTRDLVATFTLTERSSVRLEADGESFTVALSLRTDCPTRASELDCQNGFPGVIRRRALDPGTYYVILAASSTGEIGLDVTFGPPIDPPTNDTCASPIDVSAGGRFMGSTVETSDDVVTSCSFSGSPDLIYSFTTTTEQNVRITALSTTGESMAYSVRTDCMMQASEVRCDYGSPASGVIHQLPAGTYFLVVEGPSFRDADFTLDVAFEAPTPPAMGDTCSSPIVVPSDGTVTPGTFAGMENDIDVSCGFRYRDAVYQFTIAVDSDVTVELDAGMFANISTRPTCLDGATQIRCTSGNPARQRIRNLAAGTYYVIAESSRGTSFNLMVDATTPPTIATAVMGNESCTDAFTIPPTGGLFRGDTSMMSGDHTGSCGGGTGSNDAVFELTLATRSRIVASTDGSTFDTVLYVSQTACTDGVDLYCDDDGGEGSASAIDQMFDPGTYYFVVDGYGSSSAGEYFFEVLVDP